MRSDVLSRRAFFKTPENFSGHEIIFPGTRFGRVLQARKSVSPNVRKCPDIFGVIWGDLYGSVIFMRGKKHMGFRSASCSCEIFYTFWECRFLQ